MQVQAELRFIDEPLALEVNGVAKGRLCGDSSRKHKYDLSIGRGQLQRVLAGVLGAREQSGRGNKRKQQKNAHRQHSFSGRMVLQTAIWLQLCDLQTVEPTDVSNR